MTLLSKTTLVWPLAGLFLAAGPVLASSLFSLSASATANACDPRGTGCLPNADVINGAVVGPIIVSASTNDSPLGGSDTASSGVGIINFGSIVVQPQTATAVNALSESDAVTAFFGEWIDQITTTSTTLPLGSPMELAFTLSMTANEICSGPTASTTAIGTFYAASSPLIQLRDATCSAGAGTLETPSQTMMFATTVGANIGINGQLSLETDANTLNAGGTVVSATIDPPGGSFFIDAVTPGTGYVSASGATYFSSVPEPGTLGLIGFGFGGLIVLCRRNRRG